jgi:iron(III) transport system substrate-binding protein
MSRAISKTIFMVFFGSIILLFTSCTEKELNKQVVVYTSVDQVYSEPIFRHFEQESGIIVKAVYDVEASKTIGLTNRLLSEKAKPQADVFWNGEFTQTIMLKENGVLDQYEVKNKSELPKNNIDNENYWTAFGGRARVLLVNKSRMTKDEYPKSIFDLTNGKYKAEDIAIAYPVFGTTATHAAALYATLGVNKANKYFTDLKNKGIRVVDGNSVVRDLVVKGEVKMGMTDTDDALSALKNGENVEMVFLDQRADEIGTLVVPNTAAMIKNGPNSSTAKEFLEFITSKEAEKLLFESGWIDFTSRKIEGIDLRIVTPVKSNTTNYESIYKMLETSKKDMTKIFVR